MTTIDQLKKMPDGYKTGGFKLNVKTFGKKYQVGKEWYHQITLVDKTGEMSADVCLGEKYSPLMCREIYIVVSQIRETLVLNKPAKTLCVDEYSVKSTTADEYEAERAINYTGNEKEIRSKIKCWLVAAKIETGFPTAEVLKFAESPELKQIIDSIVNG